MAITDLLVCPVCQGALSDRDDGVACTSCGRKYPGGGPHTELTPNPPPDAEVAERWHLWEQLQHNFLVAAAELPEHSLSVGPRQDAAAFAAFADLRGLVLDVGCGPQRGPSYATPDADRFVGIDPTPGEPERDFDFVQGLGEYLPFPDATFDRVLFATSLDHLLSPRRSLAEARRVVRDDGSVSIWFGVIEEEQPGPPAPPPSLRRKVVDAARRGVSSVRSAPAPAGPAYLDDLEVPEGAIDLFHVEHPDQPRITAWLDEVGLEVAAVQQVPSPRSAFVRATPRVG